MPPLLAMRNTFRRLLAEKCPSDLFRYHVGRQWPCFFSLPSCARALPLWRLTRILICVEPACLSCAAGQYLAALGSRHNFSFEITLSLFPPTVSNYASLLQHRNRAFNSQNGAVELCYMLTSHGNREDGFMCFLLLFFYIIFLLAIGDLKATLPRRLAVRLSVCPPVCP